VSKDLKQKTIKQHFVPQRYLRNFKDATGVLWVYEKAKGTVFASGERAVAFEKSFYDFKAESLEDNAAEDWNENERGEKLMQHFEGELGRTLDLLLSEGPHIGVSRDVRASASFSMAIQFLRTSAFRKQLAQQQTNFFEKIFRQWTEANFPGQGHLAPKFIPGDTPLRQQHLKAMTDIDVWRMLGDGFSSHHWTFGVAPADTPFVTSDNPVSRRPHLSHLGTSYTGVRSRGIEIVYPLSSRYALILKERDYHRPPASSDGHPASLRPAEVHRLNRIVAANCDRFVFGCSSNFAEIDAFLDFNRVIRERSWERWATRLGRSRRVHRKRGTAKKQEIETYLEHVPVRWDP
jgi:hypothetical protein